MMIEGVPFCGNSLVKVDSDANEYNQSLSPAVLTVERKKKWLTVALHRRAISIPRFIQHLDRVLARSEGDRSSPLVSALHGYDACEPHELSFRRGDRLLILRQHSARTGWSLAAISERSADSDSDVRGPAEEGLVPNKYLEPFRVNPPSQPLSPSSAGPPSAPRAALPDFVLTGFGCICVAPAVAPAQLRTVVARTSYSAMLRDELSFQVLCC